MNMNEDVFDRAGIYVPTLVRDSYQDTQYK
jgi:hypothetical protein